MIELRPELLDQRRFPRAHLARDDDKSFLLREPVDKMGDRPAVAAAAEKESAIGRELERDCVEAVIGCVH